MKKKGLDFAQVNEESGNLVGDIVTAREKVRTCALELRGAITSADRRNPIEFGSDVVMKNDVCMQKDLKIKGDLCVEGEFNQVNGTYDIIMCGVGTAGCVAFRRISDADPSLSMLGLVTGDNLDEDPISKYPFSVSDPDFGSLNLFQSTTGSSRHTDSIVNYNWLNYSMNRNAVNIFAGKGKGGASNHYFLVHTRPSPGFHNYTSSFAGAYSASWNATSCNTIYKTMETYVFGPPSPNRGTTGPFKVLQSPAIPNPSYGDTYGHWGAALKATSLAVADQSAPVQIDYNDNIELVVGTGANQQGLYIDGDSPSGVSRSCSNNSYLGTDFMTAEGFSAIGRNTRLMYRAYVTRVLFDGDNNAVGVEVIVNGEKKVYKANKKVIICAGAMRSPGILERSGIGSGSLLSSLGITQVVENPNVGENFMTHSAPACYMTVAPTAYPAGGAFYALMQSVASTPYPYARSADYIFNHSLGQGYLQVWNSYGGNFTMLKELGVPLDGSNTFAGFAELGQPTSRGSVHLFDTGVDAYPKWIWKLDSPEDLYAGRTFYRHLKRVEYDLANNVTTGGTAAMGFSLKFPSPSQFAGYDGGAGAPTIAFTASITADIMTVTAISAGTIEATMSVLEGAVFSTAPASAIIQGTMVNGQVFPLLGGEVIGGIGRYQLNKSQTVGSMAMHGDYLDTAAATVNVVQAHPCGTCKMGDRLTQQGVVDGQLHVYGVQKLMVADNSIWPQIPNINTHAAAMLVGYNAADFCLATI